MVQDPSTGEGFDAVEVDTEDYFDPNATSDSWPGVVGLQMRRHHFWQGDVEFDTFDEVGPTDQSVQTADPGAADPGSAAISQPEAPPDFGTPLISEKLQAIKIELHGAYGFPDDGAGGTVCKFPVTPEEFGPDFPTNEHWYPDVLGTGEIVVPGLEKLETIGWTCFWPKDYDDDWCVITQEDFDALGDPGQANGPIANLIWTKRYGMVCRLVVGGGIFLDDVVITDFNYRHRFGEPYDYYYTINFKRYRTTTISSVDNPEADVDRFPKPAPTAPTQASQGLPDQQDTGGDNTQPDAVVLGPPAPATPDPTTVFADPDTARNQQTTGKIQNPITEVEIYDITDSRSWGGGTNAFWDKGKGETLNDIAHRMGVTWGGVQKDLNPELANKNPDEHLPVGTKVRVALSTPTIQPPAPTGPGGTDVLIPGI